MARRVSSIVIVLAMVVMTAILAAAPVDTRLPDAAMRGDLNAVRDLVKQSADVNAMQGDGMSALHWAALREDLELVRALLAAGANTKSVTRIGAITPLLLAAQTGSARVIAALLEAGADPNAAAAAGVTPLMEAATVGNVEAIQALVKKGADVNARESNFAQTPLMFAAAFNRPEAIAALIQSGADVAAATKSRGAGGGGAPARGNVAAAPGRGGGRGGAAPATGRGAARGQAPVPAAAPAPAQSSEELLPVDVIDAAVTATAQTQPGNVAEARAVSDAQGGLTPLLYAARQGHFETVKALLDNGAGINQTSADRTTPLMMAVINGHFDLAMELLQRGADPKIATGAGGTPLYRAVDVQWAPKAFYPQPSVKQERSTYLELMKALLDHGADPNVRLVRQLWYTGFGFELEGADPAGATPFWRAAEVGDLAAMRLLVAAGADPNLATNDGVTPLLVAAGDGFHGNDAITVPAGRLPAVKFLVEDCKADVNATDKKGGDDAAIEHTHTRTYTPLHAAAARGDNEMILYLVSKGARIDMVGKNGRTVADMANSPRERILPFPETLKLLVELGAKNNNRCVMC